MLVAEKQTKSLSKVDAAFYIWEMNPQEIWEWGITFAEPRLFSRLYKHYNYLGAYLTSFFDDSIPKPFSYIDEPEYEAFREWVKTHAAVYIELWALLFEGEEFIQQALKVYGVRLSRSQLLKFLYTEELLSMFSALAGEYETRATVVQKERVRSAYAVLTDSLEKVPDSTEERWRTEDEKLLRNNPFYPDQNVDWCVFQSLTRLCINTLYENRSHYKKQWRKYLAACKDWQLTNCHKTLISYGTSRSFGKVKGKRAKHS